MPTVTLVPTSLADTNGNVAAGAYTDVDNTIASASGATLDSVTNLWTGGGATGGVGSAFTFGISDLPAEAVSVNTVQFRCRARVTSDGGGVDDTVEYRVDVNGTNAPTTIASWTEADADGAFANRGASSPVTSSATVADVNSWIFRAYQYSFGLEGESFPGGDGLNFEIDEIELTVDYNVAAASGPSSGPANGAYAVLPTTDTVIYGLCIAQARDFVVLGGLDADRYSVRWSALGDETDWPTPATDDARAKQAGSQTFPTKFGYVTAIAGDDFSMLIFQETAVHRATYVGGDVVWQFETIDESRGCVRQGRMVKAGDLIFFQSKFGYHVARGGEIQDIGYGAVDDSYN